MIFQIIELITVSAVFIFLSRIKFDKLINAASAFTIVWSLTLVLNYIYATNYGIIVPGEKVFQMVIIGIVAFNITYLIFSNRNHSVSFNLENLKLNDNVFKILFWIGILLMSPNIIKGLSNLILSGMSFSAVRNQYLTLANSGRGIYVYLTNIIPRGIFTACMVMSILKVLGKEYRYLFYSVAIMFATTVAFGGRTIILEFIIEYFIAFYMFRKQNNIRINYKIIFILVLIIILLTISRGLVSGFFKMLAKYFFEQFSFLEYILNNKGWFEIENNSRLHYGTITFSFILSPFYLIASIFNDEIFVPSYYVDIHSQVFYNIGTTSYETINNNTTSIYHFILDYGENFYFFGFIFMALLLCITEHLALKTYGNNKSIFYVGVYIVILKQILYSPIYYGLYSIGIGLGLFFIWVISTRYRIVFGRYGRRDIN